MAEDEIGDVLTTAEGRGPRPAIVIPKDMAPPELYEHLDLYIAKARVEKNRLIKNRPVAAVEILCNFFGIKQ